jgi:Flp pilus assembly pilin Flp
MIAHRKQGAARRFLKGARGASMQTYGLLVGLIAVVILSALASVGDSVDDLFCNVGGAIDELMGDEAGDCGTGLADNGDGDDDEEEEGPTNVAPVAGDVVFTTPVAVAGTPSTYLRADILVNSYDDDGDTLTITSISNVTGGSANLVGEDVEFTASAGYEEGSFDFTISDGNSHTATGTATLPIEAASFITAYGGSGDDALYAVSGTLTAGTFVTAGETSSFGAGGADGVIMQFGPAGGIEWAETLGTSGTDTFNNLVISLLNEEGDVGYLAVGQTNSGLAGGGTDAVIAAFAEDGTLVWQRVIGGAGTDVFTAVVPNNHDTQGGRITAVGRTNSFGAGGTDGFVAFFDLDGTFVSAYAVGSSTDDAFNNVALTNGATGISGTDTHGIAVVGRTRVTQAPGPGDDDAWLVHMQAYTDGAYSSGQILWTHAYGAAGAGADEFFDISPRPSSPGLIAAGSIGSSTFGDVDGLMLVTNDLGAFVRSRRYGGTGRDIFNAVRLGGYFFIGDSASFGSGGTDAMMDVIDDATGSEFGAAYRRRFTGSGTESWHDIVASGTFASVIVGETSSYGAGSRDFLYTSIDESMAAGAGCTQLSNGALSFASMTLTDASSPSTITIPPTGSPNINSASGSPTVVSSGLTDGSPTFSVTSICDGD